MRPPRTYVEWLTATHREPTAEAYEAFRAGFDAAREQTRLGWVRGVPGDTGPTSEQVELAKFLVSLQSSSRIPTALDLKALDILRRALGEEDA